jgi:hypothetical protein
VISKEQVPSTRDGKEFLALVFTLERRAA